MKIPFLDFDGVRYNGRMKADERHEIIARYLACPSLYPLIDWYGVPEVVAALSPAPMAGSTFALLKETAQQSHRIDRQHASGVKTGA